VYLAGLVGADITPTLQFHNSRTILTTDHSKLLIINNLSYLILREQEQVSEAGLGSGDSFQISTEKQQLYASFGGGIWHIRPLALGITVRYGFLLDLQFTLLCNKGQFSNRETSSPDGEGEYIRLQHCSMYLWNHFGTTADESRVHCSC